MRRQTTLSNMWAVFWREESDSSGGHWSPSQSGRRLDNHVLAFAWGSIIYRFRPGPRKNVIFLLIHLRLCQPEPLITGYSGNHAHLHRLQVGEHRVCTLYWLYPQPPLLYVGYTSSDPFKAIVPC